MLKKVAIGSVFVLALGLFAISLSSDKPASSPSAAQQASSSSPALVRGQLIVNFAGVPQTRPTLAVAFEVTAGSTAWEAIQRAIGAGQVEYMDYVGLGVFITGFAGVAAQGNHYWEFFVNGQSSSTGVSQYVVKDGDVLEFRYSSF